MNYKEIEEFNDTIFERVKQASLQCRKLNEFWKTICPNCNYEVPVYRVHEVTCMVCGLYLGCND